MSPPPRSAASLPLLLLLLSVTTGLVDAVSVLGLGKVFTANMTGNIVFLGFAAVGTPGFHPLSYLVAIGGFLAGAFLAGRTGQWLEGRPLHRWLMTAAAIEAGLLWSAALVSCVFDMATQSPDAALLGIIVLTALAMGFRNATVRQLKVPDLTTTVLTLTLTGLAADSSAAGGTNPNWGRRVASVGSIFLGAALGAFLLAHGGMAVPLALAGVLILGGTAVCAWLPAMGEPR